jgi:hypothetical protein
MALPVEKQREDPEAIKLSRPVSPQNREVINLDSLREKRSMSNLILPQVDESPAAAPANRMLKSPQEHDSVLLRRSLIPLLALVVIAAGIGLRYGEWTGVIDQSSSLLSPAESTPASSNQQRLSITSTEQQPSEPKTGVKGQKQIRELNENEKTRVKLLVLILRTLH